MEGLTACGFGFCFPGRIKPNFIKNFPSSRRRSDLFPVLASRDSPELDKWDQMELKFGRLLGEDPKLTLAKIMAKKDNPHVSYLDVEKSFRKGKGKLDDIMLNLPAEVLEGVNLTSPQTQKTQNTTRQSNLNLSRPMMNKVIKSKILQEKPVFVKPQNEQLPVNVNKKIPTSNISLRKPSIFHDEDIEGDSSNFKITPNLYFKLTTPNQSSSEVTLLKKPEVIQVPSKPFDEGITCETSTDISSSSLKVNNVDTLDKLVKEDVIQQNSFEINANLDTTSTRDNESEGTSDGLHSPMQKSNQQIDANFSISSLHDNSISNKNEISVNASLLEKPSRQEDSDDEVLPPAGSEASCSNDGAYNSSTDVIQFQLAEEGEREHRDWRRAENLFKLGEKAQVELISCSCRGFVASFSSLIGFLPYRNLGTKWKYIAFESWLRKKGLDPSLHRHNLSIVGNYDGPSKNHVSNETHKKDKEMSLLDMNFEELLEAYEQEKTKYLSSFVGQRLRVSVILADRSSRRLIFSGRPKENEESVEKKRSLMARLNVGDIIKCCIKKITYFGI